MAASAVLVSEPPGSFAAPGVSPRPSDKSAAKAEPALSLAGRLYLSSSGWLLLAVPNALVRGAFAALDEPGVELPYHTDGTLNGHVSVATPEDVERMGGPDAITERGRSFRYNLGRLETVKPSSWDGVARVWYLRVHSPELERLRRSYGLSGIPNDGKYPFHCTVAVRRVRVLGNNPVSKAAGVELSEWVDDEDPGEVLDRVDAHVGGKNVGYLTSHPAADGGRWLEGMKVDPDYRGQGVARQLLQRALQRYKDQDVSLRARPYDDAPMSAEQLQGFYARYGFRPYDDEGRMRRAKTAAPGPTLGPYGVTIDRPRGHVKTFPTPRGPLERTYPVDYGYLRGLVNPDDGEEADVFLGSAGPHYGRFMKGQNLDGAWRPDERKWYARLAPEELDSVKNLFESQSPGLLRDFAEFPDEQALLSDLAGLAPRKPAPVGPPVLALLREAKARSDRRDYQAKARILRRLFAERPDEFFVDAPGGPHPGVTHAPTGFRIHAPASLVAPLTRKPPAPSGPVKRAFSWFGAGALLGSAAGSPDAVPLSSSPSSRNSPADGSDDDWDTSELFWLARSLRQREELSAGAGQADDESDDEPGDASGDTPRDADSDGLVYEGTDAERAA